MRSAITVKQILSDARMLVRGQGVNFTAPTTDSMLDKYNIALGSIFKLLNGAKVSRYYACAPLGSPAGYIKILDSDNHTYTAATKTISEAAGTALTIDSTWVGALVLYGTAAGPAVYFDTIASVTTDTSFVVTNGDLTSNLAAGNLWYIVLKKPSDVANIGIDSYRIDRIRRVHDTAVGNVARLDPDTYEGVADNPNYDNSVVMEQSGTNVGNVVRITAGSGITRAWQILFYDESPKVADDTAEYVDLPEEYHGPLIEEIARLTLLEVGAKVPKALENPLMTLQTFSDVFQASKDALSKSEDKP